MNYPNNGKDYDLTLANVARWRAEHPQAKPVERGWTKGNVQRWNSMRGNITQTVRGSHVDIFVKLNNIAGKLFVVMACAAGLGLLFIAVRVAATFISGRAAEILDAAMKASH